MLERIGQIAARHPLRIFAGWLVLLAGVWAIGIGFGAEPNNTFTLPGSPSQDALDKLDEEFPAAAGATATVVYHSTSGSNVTDEFESAIKNSTSDISQLDGVASVTGPYDNDALISPDGSTALANVTYSAPQSDLADNGADAFEALENAIAQYTSAKLQIELGGSLPGAQPVDIDPLLVVYGLIAALIILLIALGTWWAFAWPVVGSLVGVALGVGLVRILENFVNVPTISETAAVMIGLGVGTDYGLFVAGRAKDYMNDGDDPVRAAGRSVASMGRAVLTAGTTVVIALIALLIFQTPSVTAMAYSVVVVVVAVVLSALTLQPAIVGAVGRRFAAARVPWARDASVERSTSTLGERWAGFVTRRAPIMLAAALIFLGVLAIPVFKGDLRLGPLDNSLYPTDSTQYRAWELQSDGFGPGSTDPFLVVVDIPSGDDDAQSQLGSLRDDLGNADGVAAVSAPQLNSAGSVAVMQVIPTGDAQAEETAQLVSQLRDDTLPQATSGTNLVASVTGTNAVFVDLDDRITDRLAIFIGLVLLVALVILGWAFRSVGIPIKAAVFTIVTILATYGVLVAFLTYGWGRSLIGIPENIPILSVLAPVFFAVLFGLSNDYEVYLVSRMREERLRGVDPVEAVRRGLAGGGRITIAAAMIMIFVFVSYMFQPGAPVKQFGFGMAVAILLDAFVTRMTALPALMHIGGDRMWWPGIKHQPSVSETVSVPAGRRDPEPEKADAS